MNNSFRILIGILAGIVLGMTAISLVQTGSPYRPPAQIQSEAEFSNWVVNLPLDAYLIVLGSYLTGALTAGFVARWISRLHPWPGMTAGFALLLIAIANFLAYPHPEWVTYSSCIGFVLFSWIGSKLNAMLL